MEERERRGRTTRGEGINIYPVEASPCSGHYSHVGREQVNQLPVPRVHFATCAPKGLYYRGEISPFPSFKMAYEFLTPEVGRLWTDKVEVGLKTVVQVKVMADFSTEV